MHALTSADSIDDKITDTMNPCSFLLVDDEREFIETLARRLRARGFPVDCVFSGKDAVERLEVNEDIDIVVLDVAMPAPDGIRTLQQLKQKHPLIEVIMLTGHATIHSAVDALKFGAFDFLTKPCELHDLLVKAEQAVARKRQRQAQLLDARMKPYISDRDRAELISRILVP